jgi:hypothetical protein
MKQTIYPVQQSINNKTDLNKMVKNMSMIEEKASCRRVYME